MMRLTLSICLTIDFSCAVDIGKEREEEESDEEEERVEETEETEEDEEETDEGEVDRKL